MSDGGEGCILIRQQTRRTRVCVWGVRAQADHPGRCFVLFLQVNIDM